MTQPRLHFLWVLSILGFASANVIANEDDVDAFNAAYTAYNRHANNAEHELALPHAEHAYEIGQRIFDENSLDLAKLVYNYGSMLIKGGRPDDAKLPLTEALNYYESLYGQYDGELIPTLTALAQISSGRPNRSDKVEYYKRAAEIFRKRGDTEGRSFAMFALKAGVDIMKSSSSPHAESLLLDSYAAIVTAEGERGYDTGTVAMALGEYYFGQRSYRAAEDNLQLALDSISERFPKMIMSEFKIHVLLSQLYKETGREREASQHLRASRKMRPMFRDEPPRSLYRQIPEYPEVALQQGIEGHVDLLVTIDRYGLVKKVETVQVEGHDTFEVEAIRAVTRSIYWPGASRGRIKSIKDMPIRINFAIN